MIDSKVAWSFASVALQKVQSVLVVLGAGIEREAVRQQLRLIIGDLVAGHAGRESVQTQDAIPHQVVFLAPRARLSSTTICSPDSPVIVATG